MNGSGKRVALITGSTGGLGLATAAALAAAGHDVVLHGLLPADEGGRLAADLSETYAVSTLYVRADLADTAGVEQLVHTAAAHFGGIDILVNNAVTRHFSPVEDFPPEAWDRGLAVNLSAPFHAIRLSLPHMRAQDWGRIINFASVYSFFATPNRIDYVTAKTALLGLTRTVALEVAGTGISCNAICPGMLPTQDIEARIARMAAERGQNVETATRDYLATRQPSGRFISLDTVAGLVNFLCGPATTDINGAALPVDAGWTAA